MDTSLLVTINLPDEVIEEILSRCPVKSVVRFKSVSKSWQSIISDAHFSRIHRIQRSKLPENQNKFLIKVVNDSTTSPPGCTVYSSIIFEDGKFRSESESLALPYQPQTTWIFTLCHCDGLFLLQAKYQDDDHIYTLWNPSIRKHALIRPRIPETADPWCLLRNMYHDSITDDYKIVFPYEGCYTVYSCKKGICGEMKDFPRCINIRRVGASFDGCFYSVGEGGEIVCFDVRDEKVHKFRFPGDVECWGLKVVSGRVCLLGDDDDSTTTQLWVMEKNNIKGCLSFSWRKIFSIKLKEINVRDVTPIWMSNEDKVLLLVKKVCYEIREPPPKHMIYNPCGNSFRWVEFCGRYVRQCYTYSENLYMPTSNIY